MKMKKERKKEGKEKKRKGVTHKKIRLPVCIRFGEGGSRERKKRKTEVKYVRKWMEVENTVQGTIKHRKAEEAMQ
jgi:hypothetical protein